MDNIKDIKKPVAIIDTNTDFEVRPLVGMCVNAATVAEPKWHIIKY